MLPDIDAAQADIEAALESLVADGLQEASDSDIARKYETMIAFFWKNTTLEERERIGQLYRQAFGIKVAEEDVLSAPQADFASVVGEDGWFADLIRYSRPAKAMPQVFFGAALAFIAGGLGRRPLIEWSTEGLYPNTYVLLIGGTGAGKSTAVKKVQKIVQPALAPNMLPTEGSPQGYADALKRRYEETGTHADGLLVADELKLVLSQDNYKSELATWLTQWYGHEGPWSRGLRSEGEYMFENPCVSFLGASNMTWLRQIPDGAIHGGFFPRFVKFHTPESQLRWGTFAPEFNMRIAADLTARLEAAFATLEDTVKLSPEAFEWMNHWYDHTLQKIAKNEAHAGILNWYNRVSAHMLKMACVWQFADGELANTLELYWLKKSWEVLDWMRYTVQYMYNTIGVSKNSAVLLDVLAHMDNRRGAMDAVRIKRGMRNKYRASEVSAALRELCSSGDIVKVESVKVGIQWQLAKDVVREE